jgi:hypothetical protein
MFDAFAVAQQHGTGEYYLNFVAEVTEISSHKSNSYVQDDSTGS